MLKLKELITNTLTASDYIDFREVQILIASIQPDSNLSQGRGSW